MNILSKVAWLLASLIGTSMAQATPVSGQGTWETTLQARDLDGNGTTDAFFDTDLNITWLGNANVFKNATGGGLKGFGPM